MLYSPHLCAIVVLIEPACIEARAGPSFRKCCIRDATILSYTELIFEAVQVTKVCKMSIAYSQGLLERHGNNAVKGMMKTNVQTASFLSSGPGLISLPKNYYHVHLVGSRQPHKVFRCISEHWLLCSGVSARSRPRFQVAHVVQCEM